ncbi:MAG: glycosyltransferase [Bacteroidota bacterium]
MKIVVNAVPAISGTTHERIFGTGLLNALTGLIPEAEFYFEQFFNDGEFAHLESVKVVNPHEMEDGTYLCLAPSDECNPGLQPFLQVVHDIDKIRFPNKGFWQRLFRGHDATEMYSSLANAILVPHTTLRQHLINQYAIPPAKIHVVGHGLPPEELRIIPADSVTRRITKEVYGNEHSYFLAKATGHVSDNLERLFAAYDIFRRRCPEPVRLLIETEGKQQPKPVRKAHRQAQYQTDIVFLSQLSLAERRKVVSSARAVVDVSLSSAFPLPVLDAWTAEVPVVSTNREILQGAGTQVQGEDINSIAEGLVTLVTTPFLASGLVANGKRRVLEFTWEKVAERVATVIRQHQ